MVPFTLGTVLAAGKCRVLALGISANVLDEISSFAQHLTWLFQPHGGDESLKFRVGSFLIFLHKSGI